MDKVELMAVLVQLNDAGLAKVGLTPAGRDKLLLQFIQECNERPRQEGEESPTLKFLTTTCGPADTGLPWSGDDLEDAAKAVWRVENGYRIPDPDPAVELERWRAWKAEWKRRQEPGEVSNA